MSRRALVGVVLLIAACGPADAATDSATDIDADLIVAALDIDFDRDTYELTSGTKSIALVQRGQQPHTLLIESADGDDLGVELAVGGGAGADDSAVVDLAAGTYVMFCDVPGHRAAGMVATLIVTEAP